MAQSTKKRATPHSVAAQVARAVRPLACKTKWRGPGHIHAFVTGERLAKMGLAERYAYVKAKLEKLNLTVDLTFTVSGSGRFLEIEARDDNF